MLPINSPFVRKVCHTESDNCNIYHRKLKRRIELNGYNSPNTDNTDIICGCVQYRF